MVPVKVTVVARVADALVGDIEEIVTSVLLYITKGRLPISTVGLLLLNKDTLTVKYGFGMAKKARLGRVRETVVSLITVPATFSMP